MVLSDLLPGVAAAIAATPVASLALDSRAVRPGALFAALPGRKADGRAFIPAAIAAGASVILAPSGTRLDAPGVALVTDDEPRRLLAQIAARFYGRQPATTVAVTGTNGKTSVAHFTRQIWTALGLAAASLGTLGLAAPGRAEKGALTTPDPLSLHRLLAELAADGVEHLAFEASSDGLDQFRVDGVRLAAAAFTNLTRDHLDTHGSMEAYRAAKRRLFAELLPAGAPAVLNADSPDFAALAALCRTRGCPVLDYGRAGRALTLLSARPTAQGQDLDLAVRGARHSLHLPLAGTFQAANALAALGLVLATGGDADAAIAALQTLEGVPGRLQKVATRANGAAVYVDYAHTPDALETVLTALRPHATGRLVALFGCGGDRDPGKRPEMGAIAQRLADRVIVTDDNPRSEAAAPIRAAILAACPKGEEIADRRAAIRAAVAALAAGDLLVLAGKGHESGQIVGTEILPFNDADEARAAVETTP